MFKSDDEKREAEKEEKKKRKLELKEKAERKKSQLPKRPDGRTTGKKQISKSKQILEILILNFYFYTVII